MELLVGRVERFQFDEKSVKIVAAIDFGTCYTKMAFAYDDTLPDGKGAQLRISETVAVMDAWEDAPGFPMPAMAPTSILIDNKGEVSAYGYEAEEKFRVLTVAQAKVSYLFKNFKMALHQDEVRISGLPCSFIIMANLTSLVAVSHRHKSMSAIWTFFASFCSYSANTTKFQPLMVERCQPLMSSLWP